MLKKSAFATIFVTAYLIVYYILFYAGAAGIIISAMFAASPFLVVWMAITIIKHGKYTGTSLSENQEWGYEDVDLNDRK
jgi:hypothetical protein